ncbi:uncharacterized protein LOC125870716 isoform X1 [Solanum stenotomum]|uniref:uncharacterized protein LOC125870716 isoform X1 n=1 Tax=Solanum stenotomum TaxID=172797 RepID=UPI0020D0CF3D|nr:uncharacterized protein LOC125870716 isoform X1 [Solanum stenotomum]
MEGTKKTSSCSFTSDLFGSKETSASSSSSIFGSIFPPPSKGHGSMNSEQLKHDPVIQERNAKGGDSGSTPTSNEASSQQAGQNKQPSSFYQNEKVQPCHLSSSLYYGGQDVYSFPQNNNQSSTYTTNVKEAWILGCLICQWKYLRQILIGLFLQERRGSLDFRCGSCH